MTYVLLQQYWWFLISLLGALLVFLLFVQGGNSLLFALGKTADLRTLMVNSTGRKWEFTFTTLVTFGGAFFASFPLFYSTSFGGAYWLWMIILFTFVLQAVSYEFQSKIGNLLGKKTYQRFLVINGWVAPFLLGGVVATFFTGSNFIVDKGNMGSEVMPVVSSWANASHGLDALLNPWDWVLGLAVLFLSRLLGNLYFINTIEDDELIPRCRRKLLIDTVPFLLFFLTFMGYVLLAEGYAVDAQGIIVLESQKYLHNFLSMPLLSALFLAGVMGVLFGILKSMVSKTYKYGIWFAGIGTVWVVLSLFLVVGYHHTAYYPSTADLQSSLTLSNSCSSEFTLRTMAYVSMLIPFVLAYICYAWSMLNKKQITMDEVKKEEEVY